MNDTVNTIQSEISSRVINITAQDIKWPFEGKPCFSTKRFNNHYGTSYSIDPWPCYSFDRQAIIDLASYCEKRFPIGFKPHYYIVGYESECRTNGLASNPRDYDKDEDGVYRAKALFPHIVLWGKRIPQSPSMARYLLVHEYAHCVDAWICYKRGLPDEDPTQFDKEYAKMRGCECYTGYGAGGWHENIGEIIANDCRVCVFGMEREFWPHVVPHPDECPHVHEFWYSQMIQFAQA